jgi:SOS-response transcriptional repressor LexA
MESQITIKQQRTLMFIWEFYQKNRYMPSYQDIQAGLGLSSSSPVWWLISQLKIKGYIKAGQDVVNCAKFTPRVFEFVKTIDTDFGTIPVLGVCS